ncbi:hypothetical protein PIB30_088987 [Stylosanthes scabra]|uniref:Pentatricopeptide repeat-containing protein n=1 Tax=Stylosanthes scabra TaxID=79078 RepID=A0ABU6XTQ9_9FABA|nr:hypothetical protein [Stylosanthes scabra]
MAYAQGGRCEEAVDVFKKMVDGREAEPNEETMYQLATPTEETNTLLMGAYTTAGDLGLRTDSNKFALPNKFTSGANAPN